MYHQSQSIQAAPSEALGQSEAFLDFQEALSRVAPIERPVLILGERGTGKELAAMRLHYLSRRWKGPFITLNCASLSPSLLETELFGHEKGAFTGAHQRRYGRFQSADKGTLFLDEMANIPLEAQEKILRVVEYGTFEPVGSATSVEVDVRIISATNVDLLHMANGGRFMMDLLDRLSFEVLFLPPLRHRGGDILLLANHFARRMAMELGRHEDIPQFSPEAMAALEKHPWRGNVRELKNVVERAVYKSDDYCIDKVTFNPFISPYAPPEKELGLGEKKGDIRCENSEECDIGTLGALPLKAAVKTLEMTLVKQALADARYHQKAAAEALGLTYDQFRGLMRKYKNEL